MNRPEIRSILTVTLNPTLDRIIEVPGFRVGEHLQGQLRSVTPAGKAFNVSRALAVLGVQNTAVGWIGQESLPEFTRAAHAFGFIPQFTPIAAPSRENLTIIDPSGSTCTHIRDVGPIVTDEDINRLTTELTQSARLGALIAFTGSLPPALSSQRFGEMLELCISHGAAVVVDTSDEPLREAASHALWVIKPNRSELAELTGEELRDDASIIDAGRQLNRRIPIVLITLGEAGALCFADDQVWRGRADVPSEQVRSTVGCGDVFLAGFLAGITDARADIEAAFRQAMAAAAASALSEIPAGFQIEDVRRILSAVEITRL